MDRPLKHVKYHAKGHYSLVEFLLQLNFITKAYTLWMRQNLGNAKTAPHIV